MAGKDCMVYIHEKVSGIKSLEQQIFEERPLPIQPGSRMQRARKEIFFEARGYHKYLPWIFIWCHQIQGQPQVQQRYICFLSHKDSPFAYLIVCLTFCLIFYHSIAEVNNKKMSHAG